MDIELIVQLMRLLEDSNLNQLEIEQEGFRVKLQKQSQPSAEASVSALVPTQLAAPASSVSSESAVPPGTLTIDAPMVGTFYRALAPAAPSFVEIGSPVTEQTVVCVVEAMKVMNEIKAGVQGKIVDTLADNAQPVEYGQPLFLVKPTSV